MLHLLVPGLLLPCVCKSIQAPAFVFCFSSRRRHTRWPRDWSSDVCSSDLRVSFQAKETREGSDPTQAEIGPSLDFYLKPLIRLQDVTKFDLDDSKSRPLVFTVGYRYLPQANDAPATNR